MVLVVVGDMDDVLVRDGLLSVVADLGHAAVGVVDPDGHPVADGGGQDLEDLSPASRFGDPVQVLVEIRWHGTQIILIWVGNLFREQVWVAPNELDTVSTDLHVVSRVAGELVADGLEETVALVLHLPDLQPLILQVLLEFYEILLSLLRALLSHLGCLDALIVGPQELSICYQISNLRSRVFLDGGPCHSLPRSSRIEIDISLGIYIYIDQLRSFRFWWEFRPKWSSRC